VVESSGEVVSGNDSAVEAGSVLRESSNCIAVGRRRSIVVKESDAGLASGFAGLRERKG